ncbi:unnamed protein product [Linum trigynum]|uniref:Uncharacterized protein n=1 Tax=Linum trigynum TaxID=586398 RepID=A0AAV2DZI5_9ROSI
MGQGREPNGLGWLSLDEEEELGPHQRARNWAEPGIGPIGRGAARGLDRPPGYGLGRGGLTGLGRPEWLGPGGVEPVGPVPGRIKRPGVWHQEGSRQGFGTILSASSGSSFTGRAVGC